MFVLQESGHPERTTATFSFQLENLSQFIENKYNYVKNSSNCSHPFINSNCRQTQVSGSKCLEIIIPSSPFQTGTVHFLIFVSADAALPEKTRTAICVEAARMSKKPKPQGGSLSTSIHFQSFHQICGCKKNPPILHYP